jgi:putative hemolysin
MQATMAYKRFDLSGLIAWAIIVFAVLAMLAIVTAHATEKHGAAATATIFCHLNGGDLKKLHNQDTGRNAYLCNVEGKFGVVIEEGDTIITAFLKEKMKSAEQVLRYLQNAGYK